MSEESYDEPRYAAKKSRHQPGKPSPSRLKVYSPEKLSPSKEDSPLRLKPEPTPFPLFKTAAVTNAQPQPHEP